jgi:hypothetical protein
MIRPLSRNFLAALAAAPLALAGASPASAASCTGTPMWHVYESASLDAEPILEMHLAALALWRPGTGAAPPPEMIVTAGGLATRVNDPADLRTVTDFERYELDGEAHYALVYSAGEGEEELAPELSGSDLVVAFESVQDTSPEKRRYLVDIETFLDGGYRRYAALFAAGDRLQDLELEMTGSELQLRAEDPYDRTSWLVDFELVDPDGLGGGPVFAAVFDDGQRDQRFFPELGTGEFHDLVHDQNDEGFRLEGVETWRDPSTGETRIAALFVEVGDDDHLWVQACSGTPCPDDETAVDLLGDHLASAVADVADTKPGLQLVDLELPLGRMADPDLGYGDDLIDETLARIQTKDGGITNPPKPPCSHAGILHDGGTNGPPFP